MSEPVSEQIMAVVKSRLLGYTTDTQRPTRIGTWRPKDGTIVVTQTTIERDDELSYAGNPPVQAWNMGVMVACVLKPSDRDTVAIDTYRNRLWAEVIKACCDVPRWHTWGEKAINSLVNSAEEHTDDNGAFAGVKVMMMITFRTDEGNPFNVRA